MPDPSTVSELLAAGRDDAAAIGAPEREPLTYAGLRRHVGVTVEALNARGIGRNDRVAIVLPNGPEMATAFVAIACAATTAPLNPAYREEEFEFYLSDLNAKALVVEQGSDSPAVSAAKKLGIPLLEIIPGAVAGVFQFAGSPGEAAAADDGGLAQGDDVALVLHTSGTTSRPKIVPLTHRNLCASARNIRSTLALTADDRCLNVMPLFHIHGLMAAIMASLSAGASVVCTPGFNALKFFGWLDEAKPTWYTAVPTMHQAILARAPRSKEIIERANLRFIRSSSSSLPPQVMKALEDTFDAPVVEAYAMTEASHQMTSNPLPPRPRKPGTVGVAAGPEVSIMDEKGNLLSRGSVGEIVIRGPNVTLGYENNPKANEENFTNGWFRTGDQGVMDEDGYLSITGRLKEIINRGGEKISPREVDDVLMDHPAIQQVVTFAMPHPKLGEEVAAAVVLREGQQATEHDIRQFAAKHLADFKVPRKVLFLEEIPKGATGKLQRIGLAEKLGIT
jgi:acyl-CoA synthetase (AMP-forming)/AMP-acid ligase II